MGKYENVCSTLAFSRPTIWKHGERRRRVQTHQKLDLNGFRPARRFPADERVTC